MPRQALQPEGLATPKLPYSPVVVDGDLVYTAGQVGFDASGELVSDTDVEVQVRQVFENLGRCLAAAGCGFENVLKVTIYVGDWANFATINDLYAQYFKPPYPARTSIKVGLPEPFFVEIEAVARRPA